MTNTFKHNNNRVQTVAASINNGLKSSNYEEQTVALKTKDNYQGFSILMPEVSFDTLKLWTPNFVMKGNNSRLFTLHDTFKGMKIYETGNKSYKKMLKVSLSHKVHGGRIGHSSKRLIKEALDWYNICIFESIDNWRVSRIDTKLDILLPEFLSADRLIHYLFQRLRISCFDIEPKIDHYGIYKALYLKNGRHTLVIYNKTRERKKTKGNNNIYSLFNSEVLRFEYRVLTPDKLEEVFDSNGFPYEST